MSRIWGVFGFMWLALLFNDWVIMLEKLVFDYSIPKTLLVKLGGDWQISAGLLPITEITAQLTRHPDITRINLSVSKELQWDSGLIAFLFKLVRERRSFFIWL